MIKINKRNIFISLFLVLFFLFLVYYVNCFIYTKRHENFFISLTPEFLNTDRLYLKPMAKQDVDILSQLFFDREVCSYVVPNLFRTNGFKNVEETKKYILMSMLEQNLYEFTIFTKKGGEPIGCVSFNCTKPGVLWVAYWLGKKFHRQGYMSEIVPLFKKTFDACSDFQQMHIQCIEENEASYKICKRICADFKSDITCKYKINEAKEIYKYDSYKKINVFSFNIFKRER